VIGVDVCLTQSELLLGATIGAQRQIEALCQGRPDKHGFNGDDAWTVHIEGACGELAVAKVLDRYWAGTVNTFKLGGDVGQLQVRTRSKNHYDLLVRDDDKDDDIFVLVVGRAPQYRVVGWIRGKDAKCATFQQLYGSRPLAYFVPQTVLTPFSTA
jgi:hypothetical protein